MSLKKRLEFNKKLKVLNERKIAILVNTLKIGGAEKQSIYLLNAIKNTHQTIFIVFHGKLIDEKICKLIEGTNFKIVLLQGNVFNRVISVYKILTLNKIDCLFTYLTKPNFIGGIVGFFAGVNVYGGIRSTKFPFWKFAIEKLVMDFVTTKTIFNSYQGRNRLGSNSKNKSIVIQNCFPEIKNPLRRIVQDKVKIISVGRFDKAKDYRTAIKAINLLKGQISNFSYQIIGYGKLENKIRSWIEEFNLENFIEIILSPDNIPQLLDNADIYLSTSKFEGTSNSIMEAMNSSLPIVATDVGDNKKLISPGINGLLHKVGDYKNLSKSLEYLILNPDLRTVYGVKSNNILSENYSFEKFKKTYHQLIEE